MSGIAKEIFMTMTLRLLAILAIPLTAVCGFVFYVSCLILCFDACPSNLTEVITTHYVFPGTLPGLLFDCGFVCTLVVWLLLITQGNLHHGRVWWVALVLYPIIVLGALSLVLVTLGGHLIPTSLHEFNPWSVFLLCAWVGLLIWTIFATMAAFASHGHPKR